MENFNENKKVKTFYGSGIVKIPSFPKSPEEIQKALQDIDDKRFDAFVTVGGRLGNMVFPMDPED